MVFIYYGYIMAGPNYGVVQFQITNLACRAGKGRACQCRLFIVLEVKMMHTAVLNEGPEEVKWELGFACFTSQETRFPAMGLGFMSITNKSRKIGMEFRSQQHRLGPWDLNWDLKKGLGGTFNQHYPPPPFPLLEPLNGIKCSVSTFCDL